MKLANLFLFGILLSFASVVAQNDINQVDAQGNRHGLWKKTFEGSKQLRYEGTFDHGKEVGTFKFYCESCKTQPMVVQEFNKENAISEVRYYTIKGKLVSEGKMDGKERTGEWVYFHKKSSEVMTREFYKNDKLHGKKTTYYPNGTITEEIYYIEGLKQGANNYYSPEGVVLKKLQYQNDQLVGEAEYFDAFGNLTIQGNYKNGKKHGVWKYYKNGKVDREEIYPKPLNRAKN